MKKLLFMFATVAIVMVGCSKEKSISEKIVGNWTSPQMGNEVLVFNADGTAAFEGEIVNWKIAKENGVDILRLYSGGREIEEPVKVTSPEKDVLVIKELDSSRELRFSKIK